MEKKIIAIACSVVGTFVLFGTGFLVHQSNPNLFKSSPQQTTQKRQRQFNSQNYLNFLNSNTQFRNNYFKQQTTPNPKNSNSKNSTPNNSSPKNSTPNNFTPNNSTLKKSNSQYSSFNNSTPKNSIPNNYTPKNPFPKNSTPNNSTSKNSSPKNSTPNNSTSQNSSPNSSFIPPKTFNTPYVKQCFLRMGYSQSDAAILSDRYIFQKILGIPNSSNLDQIKKAIFKFSLKYHPDKTKQRGEPNADRALVDFIGVAWSFFGDVDDRGYYALNGLPCYTDTVDFNIVLNAYKKLFPTT